MGNLAKAGVALAGAAVVSFLGDATKAAAEDEASQKQLALALKNTTGATDEQIASTEAWIDGMSRSTGVADDELRPALANLVRAHGDEKKAQEDLAVAMDIAAARGIDLQTVTLAMAKAASGNVGALGRLGIATKNAKGETMAYDEVLQEASRTMGGAAAEAASTLEGRMKRMNVAWEESKETVGFAVLPVMAQAADTFAHFAAQAAGPTEFSITRMTIAFNALVNEGIDPTADKLKTLAAVLIDAEKHVATNSDSLNVLLGMLDLEGQSLQEVSRYLAENGAAHGLNEEQVKNLVTQLNIEDQAARDAARGLGVNRGELEATTAATYDQISATKELTDPLYALLTANEKLAAATDKYNDALFTSGENSPEAEAAAVDLTKAQQDLNIATARYAEEGGPASIAQLKLLASEAGLSESAIDLLIGAVNRANNTTVKMPRTYYDPRPDNRQAFAEGGVVQGPRGKAVPVIAHAGETILPTHKGGGHGRAGKGAPMTNHITINAGLGSDPNAISRALVEALQRYERANGSVPIRTRSA